MSGASEDKAYRDSRNHDVAITEGQEAFASGVPWKACPYPKRHRQRRKVWLDAWQRAKERAGRT